MKLRQIKQNNSFAYVLALFGVLGAAVVRHQLEPVLTGTIPVVIFTVPVVLCALNGGFWPGLFCTVLSAVVSDYFFIAPYYSFAVSTQSSVILMTFLAVGITISVFGQRMKHLQVSLLRQAGELEESNIKLEQSSSRKDEFLAMLAHELRNPLAGISTAAELLNLIATKEPRVARASAAISRQVRHITKLVDDLLDVSRVTRGLVSIEKKSLDLCDVLQSAVEQVRSSLEAKQQTLTLDVPAGQMDVCGDRTRLTQVISNLLANANRYSHSGSAIRVAVRSTATQVMVSVEDNGQGIEQHRLPHIFDLFMQAERAVDRSQGGLGIGLALVKKITELHEGTVAVRSAGRGQGSCFTVTLPRLQAAASPPGPQAPAAPAPGHERPRRLLIVDDNRDAADSTALLLQAHGHTVLVAYDAETALGYAHLHQLDTVILDIGMPGKDGRELCRCMKVIPHLARTTFIALSGYGQASDMALSRQAGFDAHYTKPAPIESLLAALA